MPVHLCTHTTPPPPPPQTHIKTQTHTKTRTHKRAHTDISVIFSSWNEPNLVDNTQKHISHTVDVVKKMSTIRHQFLRHTPHIYAGAAKRRMFCTHKNQKLSTFSAHAIFTQWLHRGYKYALTSNSDLAGGSKVCRGDTRRTYSSTAPCPKRINTCACKKLKKACIAKRYVAVTGHAMLHTCQRRWQSSHSRMLPWFDLCLHFNVGRWYVKYLGCFTCRDTHRKNTHIFCHVGFVWDYLYY